MKKPSEDKWTPADQIGIAMSGGGSRAVEFHLGTFEYLHRLGLLKNVTILSAASGGSFISCKYALLLAEYMRENTHIPSNDKSPQFFDIFFNLFFKDFYQHLRNIPFIKYVSKAIGRPRNSSGGYAIPSGRYTLINAAADLYADTFLKSTSSGKAYCYRDLTNTPAGYPLKHVIFNATDYHNCVAFRFSSNPDSNIGNVFFYDAEAKSSQHSTFDSISKECEDLRMADIVAASSCLPPLFELMGFPDDFAWPEGQVPKEVGRLCSYAESLAIITKISVFVFPSFFSFLFSLEQRWSFFLHCTGYLQRFRLHLHRTASLY